MAKICFKDKNFRAESLVKIHKANQIIAEYQAKGYSLTLRQLYYQFVARGLIPNNNKEYDNLGALISDARLAGLVDWAAIEDRTRNLQQLPTWNNPAERIESASRSYWEFPWKDQDVYAEVWVEKEALTGIVDPIADRLRLPYIACRGYMSQSEQFAAGLRFYQFSEMGKRCYIFHLGDHDPSGIDMTRDNDDRVRMFSGYDVTVRRLALNMDQIQEYQPPPNPAKFTDSRCESYVREYGTESWELDALEPQVIEDLIEDAFHSIIDADVWEASLAREEKHRKELKFISEYVAAGKHKKRSKK